MTFASCMYLSTDQFHKQQPYANINLFPAAHRTLKTPRQPTLPSNTTPTPTEMFSEQNDYSGPSRFRPLRRQTSLVITNPRHVAGEGRDTPRLPYPRDSQTPPATSQSVRTPFQSNIGAEANDSEANDDWAAVNAPRPRPPPGHSQVAANSEGQPHGGNTAGGAGGHLNSGVSGSGGHGESVPVPEGSSSGELRSTRGGSEGTAPTSGPHDPTHGADDRENEDVDVGAVNSEGDERDADVDVEMGEDDSDGVPYDNDSDDYDAWP